MTPAGWLLVAAAAGPLVAAGRANRSTSLAHACVWAGLALAAWATALGAGGNSLGYLALVLRGCAGVAVLGARRPGVGAWNFVVLGLFVVLLMPLMEAYALGTPLQLGTFRTVFLTVLIGMIVLNYLPTRLGFGALLLGVGSAADLHPLWVGRLDSQVDVGGVPLSAWWVGLAPTAGWLGVLVSRGKESAVDRLWASFRDRYGLVWGQRLREQFNHAAANAGINTELGWWKLRASTTADASSGSAAHETLAALMKRFGLR